MLSAKREGNSLVRRRSVAYACVRVCVCVCEDSGAAGNTQDQKGGRVLQTALVARQRSPDQCGGQ